jgi:hypothetical protein
MECNNCGKEAGTARFCRFCGSERAQLGTIDIVDHREHELPTPETSLRQARGNAVDGKPKKTGVSYKALFIGVSSVFALALVLAVATLYTAETWTKVDVPEHSGTFHVETYETGYYAVTMDDINPCYVGQDWTDCTNAIVAEYNRECTKPLSGRLSLSPSKSLCSRYSDMIEDMKSSDYYGAYVATLGSWGQLHSTPETATRQVSNNDYRPAVTHEATCYWGMFGECPDD